MKDESRRTRQTLQRKAANNEELSKVPLIVHDVLRSSCQLLDTNTLASEEGRFGHDFSRVRVHTEEKAGNAADRLNARAFTVGHHVVFAPGQYAPATDEGNRLLHHELAHVVQQNAIGSGRYETPVPLPSEVLRERPITLAGLQIYRKPNEQPERAKKERQDAVVIVGRPSKTIESKESRKDKENMQTWRAAGRALSTNVYEGLTVDIAFAGLKKLKKPIGKLYIIGHADAAGVGEVDPQGRSVSTTVEDLTKRMKAATGALSGGAPESVEILACFGGGSPKTMGRIGEALGASKIRAPVQTTVISGTIIKIQSGGKTTRLNRAKIRKLSKATLIDYIKQTDALKYYDFVPGVPHPQPAPSKEDKLNALVSVLRKTGMIPYVSYNEEPGERDAVPYWKAKVEDRGAIEENIPLIESLGMKGVIEVTIPAKEEKP
jgi:hypothetical protein